MHSPRAKNLVRYVVPAVLSYVSVFLYSVVDGIFVGRGVGTDALGAVNIAFPFIMIFSALVTLVLIGGMTLTAIRLGRGDEEGANRVFLHAILAAAVIGTVFTLLSTVFVTPVSRLMGANDLFLPLVKEYLLWYGVFMLPCAFNNALCGFCRNDGDPILVSVATVIATMLNIVGDYVLIFPLHMGLKGAAIATGAAQTIQLFILLSHFARKKGILRFRRFTPEWSLYGKMVVRGLPECVSQFCTPVSTIVMNYVLLAGIGEVAVNTFSVIAYVASFAVAAFVGTAEGLQPLFGNCYGAGQEEDLRYYKRTGILIAITGSALIALLVCLFARPICSLYGVDEQTMNSTLRAMPLYAWGFVMQAGNVIISSYLYSTTRTAQAVVINVLRSFVLNVLAVIVLPLLFGTDPVIWLSFGIYEGICLIIAAVLLLKADRGGAIKGTRE